MAEIYSPKNLFSGTSVKKVTTEVTVLAGQNLNVGDVVGVVTASGKVKKLDKAASDGSQVIYGIMAEAMDATGGDKKSVAFIKGEFNQDAVSFVAGTTVADVKAKAKEIGILFGTVVS